jgi:hypothetical protein
VCFGLSIVRSDKLGDLLQMGVFTFVLALGSLVDLLIRINAWNDEYKFHVYVAI